MYAPSYGPARMDSRSDYIIDKTLAPRLLTAR